MNQLLAFGKKEWMELLRSGKLLVLLLLFCLFGIMNPAVAKLTPWMMEVMSDSLAETGLVVNSVTVDAMTSWTQFYKNVPVLLIVMVVMFGGILAAEVQKGTLIPIVTKGMKRWKIVISKSTAVMAVWTAGYLICFVITYVYNAYFWDNGAVRHVVFGAVCFWLFGMWVLSLITLGSGFCSAGTGVILFCGLMFGVSYLAGLFPVFADYMPTKLMSAAGLLAGAAESGDYAAATAAAVICIGLHTAAGILFFNKKNI